MTETCQRRSLDGFPLLEGLAALVGGVMIHLACGSMYCWGNLLAYCPPSLKYWDGGAGTGTFRFEGTSGVYTEIQAGSYVFMDADYGRVLDADGDPMHEFEHSLFVLATVMSRVADDRVIIDGGLKSFAVDSGLPLVADHDEAIYVSASDEHGRLSVSGAARAIALGDRLRLIPGHCDPTVNLHDWYVGVRGGVVETVWPVAARGAVF